MTRRASRRGGVIGRFELVREIGRGGFGVVWEALDRELGRAVAFKAVRLPAPAAMPDERRLREAELAARLSHPNIVTLHDVGRGQTRATKQGVYHYEVAFTIESKVFALFGCPSAEVRK